MLRHVRGERDQGCRIRVRRAARPCARSASAPASARRFARRRSRGRTPPDLRAAAGSDSRRVRINRDATGRRRTRLVPTERGRAERGAKPSAQRRDVKRRSEQRRIMGVWSCSGSAPDMRVFAICQDELVIRMLDEILLPSFEVEFLVESRPLARRLHDAGIDSRPPATPGASTPTSKPTSPPAPASSSKTTAGAA